MSRWNRGTRRLGFWLVLLLPAIWMLRNAWRADFLAMDLLRPTGETAMRLMVLALLPGPLAGVIGPRPLLQWWLSVRRYLGVAAFGYALLHLVVYILDMGRLASMLAELALPGIWTGWLALLALVLPAVISTDSAMRALKRNWKRLQRLVYIASVAAMVHWLLLDASWGAAILHAAPVVVAWGLRAWVRIAGQAAEVVRP